MLRCLEYNGFIKFNRNNLNILFVIINYGLKKLVIFIEKVNRVIKKIKKYV